ncbi:hypothetical protein GYA44_00865 [Candidatus Microgenomates bacterium]|jgi:hypothetical protein|nr:hypothetical protein [Candidatus Microgenomates bacterium]
MDQNNNSVNINMLNESDYLVTKQVDPSTIPTETSQADLELLNKAEQKSQYKSNIAKNIKNPQLQRAVSSLKLVNPFKGY